MHLRYLSHENVWSYKYYPMEACGILVGKIGGSKKILDSSPAYQIDPLELLRVFEEAEF